MKKRLLALALSAVGSFTGMPWAAAAAAEPGVADPATLLGRDQPFDHYTWLTTHNAFTSNGLLPNQSATVAQQLDDGVRAFMLDLHPDTGRVALCHNTCSPDLGTETFAHLMNETVLPYLGNHPDAIITFQIEDFTTREQLVDELNRIPALAGITFDPESWATPGWPTYQQILDRGQRLLIFSLGDTNIGGIPVGEGTVHIMPTVRYTVENYWSLGMTVFQHDDTCRSRWPDNVQPLNRATLPNKPGWRPLFTMNHFHGLPSLHHAADDNAFDTLRERYINRCLPATRRKPNYVAVDFYERGDTSTFVDWLNAQPPAAAN